MRSGSLHETDPGPLAPVLDRQAEIEKLDRLADWLDSRYRIPLVGWRFGWDAIFGLLPGVGDVAVALPSAYLIYRAHKLGLPRTALVAMAANVALDTVVGSVPILGNIFDLAFKANRRNFGVLRRHLSETEGLQPRSWPRRQG